MTRVKVSELKNNLSRYLASARRGETVVVCDRSVPIARIVPYEDEEDTLGDDFVVTPAKTPLPRLDEIDRVKLVEDIDFVALIREDRDQ